jgi:Protein of unknown function DUF262
MSDILRRDSNSVSIAVFWENFQLGKYDFNPPYQRLSIWSEEKKSFLINSILLNYPMPPIFMREQINNETGKTSYQIIDGKQRLTSIIEFIQGLIPVSDEKEEGVGGKYFDDLIGDLSEFRKRFWRYVVSIEYIDTENGAIIDGIFDRLNRNGEKLEGQELRNAKYHETLVAKALPKLKSVPFWVTRLAVTDAQRMEDDEFISELLFYLLENDVFGSTQSAIDGLYEKYKNINSEKMEIAIKQFMNVSNFMEKMGINYEKYRVAGVSHLFGLWVLSKILFERELNPVEIGYSLNTMFDNLRSEKNPAEPMKSYKNSMYSRTKFKGQREKRLAAMIDFLHLAGIVA